MRGHRNRGRLPLVAAGLATAIALAGCSYSKADGTAPSQAKAFTFTAPGGQTRITYEPPESRGQVRGLSGEDLVAPEKEIGLGDFSGQVVVLNVWGAWCGPCREEMPDLQQIHEQMSPSGVTVLGIDVRDDRAAATDFVRNRGITYPSIFDQPGRTLAALSGFPRNTVPSTIVLDRRHRVAAVYLTAVRLSELLPVVRRVAAEPRASNEAPPPEVPS